MNERTIAAICVTGMQEKNESSTLVSTFFWQHHASNSSDINRQGSIANVISFKLCLIWNYFQNTGNDYFTKKLQKYINVIIYIEFSNMIY